MKFDGSSGKRPSTEARRYIYRVLAASIDNDVGDLEGWLLGGIVDDADRRRIRKAAKAVVAELLRKGGAVKMGPAADFTPGDVVFDVDDAEVLGIVTNVRERSLTVVYEHGGRARGPGLLRCMKHREPMVRVDVPEGALANRGWNREQAVMAALRRAGLRS